METGRFKEIPNRVLHWFRYGTRECADIMHLLSLGIALNVAWILRLAFIALQWGDLESLWYDYEHRGLKFRIASLIDMLTNLGFCAMAIYSFYWFNHIRYPLGVCFVGVLGMSLLNRLPISRFPRTNIPGALADAHASLITNLILSFASALLLTGAAAIYLWMRK